MDSILLLPVVIPIITGLISLLIPWHKARKAFAVAGMLFTFAASIAILLSGNMRFNALIFQLYSMRINLDLLTTHFNTVILIASSFFGLLITLYSLRQMEGQPRLKAYYIYLLLTVGISNGAVLTNNLLLLLIFWGIIPVLLFLMIRLSGSKAQNSAVKSLIIVGSTDFIMLLGVIIMWQLKGNLNLNEISIPVNGLLPTLAFLFMITGALGKAGSMPFHTWIPDAAEVIPASVMAFLPAALDKLLGIYLLIRITVDLFVMDYSMKIVLMSIGAITIIAAVMMALIQKNLNKLLAYHSVSQVGYMVLGIGTGIPIGIAGGLFHMLNNTLFKTCLFLCSGSVTLRTRINNLAKLGGLARAMPVTFISCVIASLSISGVPPFNGFVSKWMIYQGTIDFGGSIWPVFLIAAMFGSALTLASFVKVVHSVFLGEKPDDIPAVKEVRFSMKMPMVILALLCVFAGVFAQIPLKYVIEPVKAITFEGTWQAIRINGLWSPTAATLLLILSLLFGLIFYKLGNLKSLREGDIFIGGEPIDDRDEVRIRGDHFYDTIESVGLLKFFYKKAKERNFDLYERFQNCSVFIGKNLKKLHTGLLQTYYLWVLIGLAILLLILMK
jgi:formate hydrogenlyase subunit 3/multisubunit Na+/H+ antiporter MnhD subunit